MRLRKFRVQNYKKIRDTGWISCENLTVFVGKNESGKSAIFRGLSKLNPSDGEKYDGLKEFPRSRYTDEFNSRDWPVASAVFELETEEQRELVEICPFLENLTSVECTRHYSWKLTVDFDPQPAVTNVTVRSFISEIQKAKHMTQESVAPEGKGEPWGSIKSNVLNLLDNQHQSLLNRLSDEAISRTQIEQLITAIKQYANEQWQKDLLQPIVEPFQVLVNQAEAVQQLQKARQWVEQHLPKFVYFDRYDVLDSAIHIPSFISQLNTSPQVPRVRTTLCLFKHVGLDLNILANLGRHQPGTHEDANVRRQIDERMILASSASIAMTKKFADWWDQRKHKFHYRIDGDYFRVWVSDDLDPSEIELEQRSLGMQYFFSFFTVFLVEAQDNYKNCILLLDEPGLHMHGTAQAKLVKFLEKLSKDNQLMYTTHSPFMIDADHLERARAVYEDEDGTTKVSEDVWPRDKDSLFPLQAALGYQLAQSLFLSKRQLIVEGITDYWILKALQQVLSQKGLPTLREDIVIIPAAGVSKLLPLASMLIGHNIEIAALLDGDEPARKEGKKLVDKLLAGEDRKCLFIGDFVERAPTAELEDIFPLEYYLSAVKEAYPEFELAFKEDELKIAGVVPRLQALFERRGYGRFEKWKAAQVLRDRILEKPDEVPEHVYDIITKVFRKINELFS